MQGNESLLNCDTPTIIQICLSLPSLPSYHISFLPVVKRRGVVAGISGIVVGALTWMLTHARNHDRVTLIADLPFHFTNILKCKDTSKLNDTNVYSLIFYSNG